MTDTADPTSDAEFVDEVARVTERIEGLHGDHRIAAACRGSANPAALHWLAGRLGTCRRHSLVDLGAGLGGPAAWFRARAGCDVVAADPSPAAAAGAHRLFGLAAVQASADATPFASGAFDAVLALGVLSVVDDRLAVVREARRIGHRFGVLDYCSTVGDTVLAGGSRFPTPDRLAADLAAVWPDVDLTRIDVPTPDDWAEAADDAREGLPETDSERAVVAAIDAGRLALYAAVAR